MQIGRESQVKMDFLPVQNTENDVDKLKAVIFLQSVYRGYLARRRVQEMKERSSGQETAVIFFLQQVENSSEHIYNCQKTTRKLLRA